MLRFWRQRRLKAKLTPRLGRWGLRIWAFLAKRPRLYGMVTGLSVRMLAILGRRRGYFRRLPLAGGWTDCRDLPASEGETFQRAWAARREGGG